jgi:hypothetical protein
MREFFGARADREPARAPWERSTEAGLRSTMTTAILRRSLSFFGGARKGVEIKKKGKFRFKSLA